MDAVKSWPLGKAYDGGEDTVDPIHVAQYAAATNDLAKHYVGDSAIAPPLFHVRLLKSVMVQVATDPDLNLNMQRLVHGEHQATFHRHLRHGDRVQLGGTLQNVVEKSSGLLVTSRLTVHVQEALAVEAFTSFFIRAPVDSDKPKRNRPNKPKPPPDHTCSWRVDSDQSHRYASASLDNNAIHVDPVAAQAAGLPTVILHGLCTMAMTGKSLVDTVGGGDPRQLKQLGVRFASPVFNGDRLQTRVWTGPEGVRFLVANDRSQPVITHGVATFGR